MAFFCDKMPNPNKYCAVVGCDQSGPSFFSMPRDNAVREEWIKATRNPKIPKGLEYRTSHRICSKHFLRDDFLRSLQSEIMGAKYNHRPALRPGAIPKLFLPLLNTTAVDGGVPKEPGAQPEAEVRMSAEKRKELVESALMAYEAQKAKTEEPTTSGGRGDNTADGGGEAAAGGDGSGNAAATEEGGESSNMDPKVGKYISQRVDALLEQNAKLVGGSYSMVFDENPMSRHADEEAAYGSRLNAIQSMMVKVEGGGLEDHQPQPQPQQLLIPSPQQQQQPPPKKAKKLKSKATSSLHIAPSAALERSREIIRQAKPLKAAVNRRGVIYGRPTQGVTGIVAPRKAMAAMGCWKEYTPSFVEMADGQVKYAIKAKHKATQVNNLGEIESATVGQHKWMRNEVERQKKVIADLKDKIRSLKNETTYKQRAKERKKVVVEELQKHSKLTMNQITCLLNRSAHVRSWDLRSVVMPLIQFNISQKAYFFASKTSVVPIPSVSSLKKWQKVLQNDPEKLREALAIIDEDNDFEPNYVRGRFLDAVKGNSDVNLCLSDVMGEDYVAVKQETNEDELELGVDEDEEIDEEDLEGADVGDVVGGEEVVDHVEDVEMHHLHEGATIVVQEGGHVQVAAENVLQLV